MSISRLKPKYSVSVGITHVSDTIDIKFVYHPGYEGMSVIQELESIPGFKVFELTGEVWFTVIFSDAYNTKNVAEYIATRLEEVGMKVGRLKSDETNPRRVDNSPRIEVKKFV
jgi:hypothetical protein